MEFVDDVVILMSAPNAVFEEFFVQYGSLFGCGVPCVWELSDYLCELCIGAGVKKRSECGCCVLRGYAPGGPRFSFPPRVDYLTSLVVFVGGCCLRISCVVICDGLASEVGGGVARFSEMGLLIYISYRSGLGLVVKLG